MRKSLAKTLVLVVALSLFSIVACARRGGPLDTINVTFVMSPLNVPSIVERELGIFAQAFDEFGIGVAYSTLTAGPDQTAALASGDIQFLFAVGGTSVIQAAAGGLDIRIISIFSRAPEAFMLFSNDHGISSPHDLAGRTIAGPMGTILHQLLVAFLESGGLTTNDVNFVSMGIPEAQAALAAGAVDAALMAGPAAFNTQQGGAHVVTNGVGLVEATIVVATSQAFYNANRPLVERFLQAQNDTLAFIAANHARSMEMTAAATGLALEAVELMFPMYDFRSQIFPSDIQSLEETMQFMIDNGMIDNAIDIRGLILNLSNVVTQP